MALDKTTGMALAMAAASMFALAPTIASAADEMAASVHCYGINSCKGKNDCKTVNNSCKGQSSCKGKAFLNVSSEKECADKGGKVEAEKSKGM